MHGVCSGLNAWGLPGCLTEAHLVSVGFGGPPACGLPEATGSGACLGACLRSASAGLGLLGQLGACLEPACLGPAGGDANPFDYLELLP